MIKLDGEINFLDIEDIYKLHSGITEPSTDSIPFYGSSEANVNLIVYLDIESEQTLVYFEDSFPKIKEEFINTGKIKYYQKHYITDEDITKKTNRYYYVQSFYCVAKNYPELYYDYYFVLIP